MPMHRARGFVNVHPNNKHTHRVPLINKYKSQMYQYEISNSSFYEAIPTSHSALQLSVIQPVFTLPYLRVQFTNHHVSDLTWQQCVWWEEWGHGLVVAPANIVKRISVSGTFVSLFKYNVGSDLQSLSIGLFALSFSPVPCVCQLLCLFFFLYFCIFLFIFVFSPCLLFCSYSDKNQPFDASTLSFQAGSELVLWDITTLEIRQPAGLII